jgi:putative transposase
VPYYHVVFTLPAAIADIAYQNKAVIYDLLFKASAETLITIAADPEHLSARIGVLSVLHTWGSALTHHPHVHMIVPGGGISLDGKTWVACRPGFFLPVRVLSRLFRRLFLEKLAAAHKAAELQFFGNHAPLADAQAFAACLAPLRDIEWVVYSKRPFGGPKQVLAYLARYTHRVAISNSRLIAIEDKGVTFKWKDYRIEGRRDIGLIGVLCSPLIVRIQRHDQASLCLTFGISDEVLGTHRFLRQRRTSLHGRSTAHCRYGFVRGADHHVCPALRPGHCSSVSAGTGLGQCDGASNGGLDRAADQRGLSLGRGPTLPDPRP